MDLQDFYGFLIFNEYFIFFQCWFVKTQAMTQVLAVSFSIFDFPLSISLHSVLRLFTGFATAALIAWKLMVMMAIKMANSAATRKTHH